MKIADLLFYGWFTVCVGGMAIFFLTVGDIEIGAVDAVLLLFLTTGLFFMGLIVGDSVSEFIKKLQRAWKTPEGRARARQIRSGQKRLIEAHGILTEFLGDNF